MEETEKKERPVECSEISLEVENNAAPTTEEGIDETEKNERVENKAAPTLPDLVSLALREKWLDLRAKWKLWNPFLPTKLGTVATAFNERSQDHRRCILASIPCVFLLIIIIIAASVRPATTRMVRGGPSAAQQGLINALSASGALSGSNIHVQQLNPSASAMVAASGLTGGGNLQFTSSVTNPNVAQEFSGSGASTIPAPQQAATSSIPTLESKYTVMVYKGTVSVYGLTNAAYSAMFLMPKTSTSAADARVILKISASGPTGSLGSVIPALGRLLPSDAWTSKLKFSGSILLASHNISTREVYVTAGISMHSNINASGLQSVIGSNLAAKFPTLNLNLFAPVGILAAGAKLPSLSGGSAATAQPAALANADKLTASICMGNYVAGSVPMSGMKLVVSGVASNPMAKFNAGVDMRLPYGGQLYAPLEASFSKTGGFQMSAAIQSFSLGAMVDKYLTFSNMAMSAVATPSAQLWDVKNLTFSAAGIIKATNPIKVAVTGAASFSQAQKASLYFDAGIAAKVQPATLLCDMGIAFACKQSVKDLATKLGLNAQVNANLVVAYGDASVSGKLVAAGVSLQATVTPSWSTLTALGPLSKLYDFQAVTVTAGLTANVFTDGSVKASIFVKNAKLKDTAWTGKIAFPSFGVYMTTSPVQLGAVAEMTYKVSSSEVLSFHFQMAMSATAALTVSANMNSLWRNAFGINAMNLANVGMTLTFDAASGSLTKVGMAGDLMIGANRFKSMVFVSASGPPALSGQMDNLRLKDLFNWGLNVSGVSGSITFSQLPAQVQTFMNDVKINKADFKSAVADTTIGNMVFKKGFKMVFASIIYGATLDANIAVKQVTLGNSQVQDVVFSYVVKGLAELTNLGLTLVTPVKQLLLDFLNSLSHLGVSSLINLVNGFNFNTLLSVQEIAVDNFGLVSSTSGGGAPPSVAANVTIAGAKYTWVATMPISALTGGVTPFIAQAGTTFAASVTTNILTFQKAVFASSCSQLAWALKSALKAAGIC
jgi:hypothetical protein